MVRNSVVSFTLRFNTDGKKVETSNFGTGFFVTDKYVATAWHVSEQLKKERNEIGEKYIEAVIQKSSLNTNDEFTVPITFVDEDKENDLAVFSFDSENIRKQWNNFVINPLPLSDKLPDIGDEIVSTGFFNVYNQPFTSIGTVAMITKDDFKIGDVNFNQAIFSDLTTLSGHSGGPVCSLEDGKVVGINTRVLNPNNDRVRNSISTNSLHLKKLLTKISESKDKNQNTPL